MQERMYHHGIPIDSLTERESLRRVQGLLLSHSQRNHLVTLTISMYNAARIDPEFRQVLNEATLVIPESFGLMLYSKLIRPSFGKLPGGIYLARKAVALCEELDKKVVIIGSHPENRRRAVQSLHERFPSLKIDAIDGEYSFTSETDSDFVANQLDTRSPDFTLMAGTQVDAEKWINNWLIHSGAQVRVVGNFGRSVNYEAGIQTIPPRFLTVYGVGWLVQLFYMDNKRRARYFRDLKEFGDIVLKDVSHSTHSAFQRSRKNV